MPITDSHHIEQQMPHSTDPTTTNDSTSSQPISSKDLQHQSCSAGGDRRIDPPTSCNAVMTPRTTNTSTAQTYGYSFSQGLSSSPSVFSSTADEGYDQGEPSPSIVQRTIRRRTHVSKMQHTRSALELPRHQGSPWTANQRPERRIVRRPASTKSFTKANARFSSPDRYTSKRPSFHTTSSPFRTSYHPSLLETNERLNRCKTDNLNIFRSVSEGRMHPSITRPAPNRLRSFQPPHYNPSFIQAGDRGRSRDLMRPGPEFPRRASAGSVWRLSGWHTSPGQMYGVDLGNGAVAASGSNAPMVNGNFLTLTSPEERNQKHEQRLALALHIDTAQKVLPSDPAKQQATDMECDGRSQYQWFNGGWTKDYTYSNTASTKPSILRPEKVVPAIAFRVLDAPRLKDDYYCSVLAYCHIYRTLAVALAHRVYLWTEKHGVRYPPLAPVHPSNHVTSLAFSSEEGTKAILATARHSGHVVLWSLLERKARFDIQHSATACSVAFRPTVTKRYSSSSNGLSDCEDLLVGDDAGRIYYYSVEWPENEAGSVLLLVKLNAHSQNVCGLAWAPHGKIFVSGGNDNVALLFDVDDVFGLQRLPESEDRGPSSLPSTNGNIGTSTSNAQGTHNTYLANRILSPQLEEGRHRSAARNVTFDLPGALRSTPNLSNDRSVSPNWQRMLPQGAPPTPPRSPAAISIEPDHVPADPRTASTTNIHRFAFNHSAAVKALAFAPWQPSLLATSGGSNDRQIHFHYTETGTTLAVINVFAQVTSLVWSHTRREIAATFGYAQPEHDVRIAVFAWPSCECVVSIPWERKANGEIGRALWAIPYPGGPNDAAPELSQREGDTHDIQGGRRYGSLYARVAGSRFDRGQMPPSPSPSPQRRSASKGRARMKNLARGEGETWASRTEEEGSLIVACCDQTIKFFEVWAGKSKGKSRGLGSKTGVLGGSRVLEGWCDDVAIEEIGRGEDVIR